MKTVTHFLLPLSFVLAALLVLPLLMPCVTVQAQQIQRQRCPVCGKLIRDCPYRFKHPQPQPEKKCATCGKAVSKCPFKGSTAKHQEAARKQQQRREEEHQRQEALAAQQRQEEQERQRQEALAAQRQEAEQAFQSQGIVTVNDVSFRMIKVVGGTFQMGSNSGSSDEKPVHSVTLPDYYIGETEVTQELWQAVMGSNPSKFEGSVRPVENVSWMQCQTFIEKLNELTGRTFRLPTEAEWEFAARGGTQGKGYTYSGSNTIGDVAWYKRNSGDTTHDVATKQPNELGIYDMTGNVCEWCQDWYGSYSSSAQTNPAGSASGTDRVMRGSGWGYNDGICRTTDRSYSVPTYRSGWVGLRLAL